MSKNERPDWNTNTRTNESKGKHFDDNRENEENYSADIKAQPDYSKPNLLWKVKVIPEGGNKGVDPKVLKERQLNNRLNEEGEAFLRKGLVKSYDDRESAKKVAADLAKIEKLKLRSSKTKNNDKAAQSLRKGGVRRSSNMIGKTLNDMNTPEYVYQSLRDTGEKKFAKTAGAALLLSGLGLGGIVGLPPDEEREVDGFQHIDDEETYQKQKFAVNKLLNDEHEFEREGLMFYRFNYDASNERWKEKVWQEKIGRMTHTSPNKSFSRKSENSGGLSTHNSFSRDNVIAESDNFSLGVEASMHKFDEAIESRYRGSAKFRSDMSAVNLGRLRRAVNQRLNGISKTNTATSMINHSERDTIVPEGSKEEDKETSVVDHENFVDGPESPLGEIHSRAKKHFMQEMGFNPDWGDNEIRPCTVDEQSLEIENRMLPALQSTDSTYGVGSYSPLAHERSISGDLGGGVSGSTRLTQDSLIIAQLQEGIIPQAFIRRSDKLDSIDIDISHYSIGDRQGGCLGTALKDLKHLRKLNLEDNRLSKDSLPSIIRNLQSSHLLSINLSANMMHNKGAIAISEWLGRQNILQTLILSQCSLKCSDIDKISKALKLEESSVTDLNLSNNFISVEGSKTLTSILKSERCSIRRLDLSWNCIGTEGASVLAAALQVNKSLELLMLAANSISDQGGQRIAYSLSFNNFLRELSLAQNSISGGSCFVFSKTVEKHPTLMKLDLSFNPVGEAGARSFYRRIMRGLRCFVIMRSCSYFINDKIFNYTTPSLDSPYNLDLEEPYKAAVLSELLIMAAEDPSSCRFGKVIWDHNGRTEELNLYEKNGEILWKGKIFSPPHTGKMTVEFFSSVSAPSTIKQAPQKSIEILKLIVTHAREQDRIDYLKLITADLYMTTAQAQSIISTFMEHQIIGSGGLRKMDMLACTWTRLIDTKNMHDFMCENIQALERRALINEVSIEEYKFNWTNPTGHWRLNLEQNKQLVVMMKLISINNKESEYSRNFKFSGREDTSQEGNWFNFRNTKIVTSKGATDIVIDQAFVDKLPKSGIIEFDYVSTSRPGANPTAEEEDIVIVNNNEDITQTKKSSNPLDKYEILSDEQFYDLVDKLRLSNRKKLQAADSLFPLIELQLAVTKYWFSVHQVMAVMDMFQDQPHTQANVAVTMFGRTKDLYNMDILLRNTDKITQREIINRLGCLNVFNPLKLAFDYKISMLHLDERILLTTLLEIGPQEGTEAIREDPRTDVSILTFYGALHRIVAQARSDKLLFTYLDFGVQSQVVAWNLRRDAIKKFLVGTKPIDKAMYRIVGMHREMEKHGTLSRGPIELQYTNHFKIMKNIRIKQKQPGIVKSQAVAAIRGEVEGVRSLKNDESTVVGNEVVDL